jgi:hypothetical protein
VAEQNKTPELLRLKLAVTEVDTLAQRAFTKIAAVADLALAALESPRCDLERVAAALSTLVELSEIGKIDVNAAADRVGCGFCDVRESLRSERRQAALESWHRQWFAVVSK